LDIDKYLSENQVCLSKKEVKCVLDTINSVKDSNLLVFGVGNDSRIWIEANDGETLFIEDSLEWSNKIRELNPRIKIVQFEYPKRIREWRYLLEKESELEIEFPSLVSGKQWDIIFVDAPLGNYDPKKDYRDGLEPSGRMYSIYAASKLVKDGGYVLVHDCCRDIEIAYSDRFLKSSNLEQELRGGYRGGKGVLRKYRIKR
jgi:glucuronoxylan 4-O-methyltransferase